MRRSAKITGYALLALLVLTACIWYAVIQESRNGLLTVSFLNIGQGDSIFIDAPSGRQVLIDGGPSGAVLRELSKVMPWYDRTIDVVIPTHPDADHIGGLVDVLPRYKIGTIVHSDAEGDTATAKALGEEQAREGAQQVIARRGQIINLGTSTGSGLTAYLEILAPDRSVKRVETNTGCVVVRLVYGKTSFMLSCDAPKEIEDYLVRLDGADLHSDVLKAGHHGSKNSSSELFVGFVNPAYGVFSRGCKNKYGHPAPEVVALFERFGIPTSDTCKDGTVTFVSDGEKVVRK
ncbi:MAG: MBL fold metallo-hydrolase [Candidatus Kaiserbacteria bacterium]|nr:MBL fold metallo-hydrolase [Candidatus Kaiserbacteria bacterium]